MSESWTEYHYQGIADHDDPTKYENQVRQTGRFTASVWVVHMDVPEVLVKRALDGIAYVAEVARADVLTGEWGYHEGRLSVYYRASRVVTAVTIGRGLVRDVVGNGPDYSITPAGNWDDVVVDARLPKAQLPKEGGPPNDTGEATEAEGEPGQ